jgi:chitodextrinase
VFSRSWFKPTRRALCLAFALFGLLALSRPTSAAIGYIQSNSASPNNSSVSSLSVTFTSAQTAGNFNVVALVWNTGQTISSITDTKGNSYVLAIGPTTSGAGLAAIYYAKNIAAATAGSNTVTVTYSAATSFPDIRIAEYSGISTTSPLDVTAVATGTGTTSDSGSATTTNANDLLIGANAVSTGTTGAGTGFTQRQITGWDGNILEDRIVTATGAYNATAPLSPSGSWVMQMAAFKGASGGSDTQPPTAPTGLQVLGTPSSTQINVQWTASTDNVGVTGYLVERCQGSGCTTFAQVGTPSGTSFNDTGLTAATSYSYRLRATDAADNLSSYSSTITATTAASIAYVQSNSASPNNSSVSTLPVTFTSAQTAGNFIVVGVSWASSTTVSSITDSKGNTYSLAVGPTTNTALGATAAIYYANNIATAAAGANTVTVAFSSAVPYPDIRVAEYSGISTTSPLDVTAVATGDSATTDSGSASTTNANDLIVGSNAQQTTTSGAGTGFTSRQISGWDGNILEDRIVSSTGAYDATAPISPSGNWIMQMAAFKSTGSGGGDTSPPSTPTGLTTTAAASTQINLSWSASTDNIGVTGYRVERCSGSGCSTFTQVGTPTGTSYSDTGLTASTSYTYRVRATDAAGNLSGYSSNSSTTTLASGGDTTPPSAPTALSATATSSSQINLTWTASTDNVGVTGYRVERCQGTSCSSFAQIGTPTATSYSDSGLTASTSYSYRVRATDAAGNLSGYSSTASATTSAGGGDTQAPTAPTVLSVLASSSVELDLTWVASTDNVGVTAYLVERCTGAGCSAFAQIGSLAGAPYYDSSPAPGTAYSYRVRATDAAGNLGPYSNVLTTTTPASSPDCN